VLICVRSLCIYFLYLRGDNTSLTGPSAETEKAWGNVLLHRTEGAAGAALLNLMRYPVYHREAHGPKDMEGELS
jgi:hypothetical protein